MKIKTVLSHVNNFDQGDPQSMKKTEKKELIPGPIKRMYRVNHLKEFNHSRKFPKNK